MFSLPLTLVLELPPLAFGSAWPATQAFQPPWALTCPIEELGRPRILPLRLPRLPTHAALSPEALRPRGPERPLGPVPDIFLLPRAGGMVLRHGRACQFRCLARQGPS